MDTKITDPRSPDAGAQAEPERRPMSTADIAGTTRRGDESPRVAGASVTNAPMERSDSMATGGSTVPDMTPASDTRSAPSADARPASATAARTDQHSPLFDESSAGDLRERWTDVQAGFVDEPSKAVEQADALVAEVMQRLADGFAKERSNLEGQWSRGDDVSTEDLRVALQRYRSFFDRLLAL